MVHGARTLDDEGHKLYFLTLTCRGRELELDDANENYMLWTNRFLTAFRAQVKRAGSAWHYVQVTERQARGHPHSHLIMTARPSDATFYARGAMMKNGRAAGDSDMQSAWLVKAAFAAGLGPQVALSEVRTSVAVAAYVAKYLFKDAIYTAWPKRWRRIRYSQSWPKLPVVKPEQAWPLIRHGDWLRLEDLGTTVWADSEATREAAMIRRITCVAYKRTQVQLVDKD